MNSCYSHAVGTAWLPFVSSHLFVHLPTSFDPRFPATTSSVALHRFHPPPPPPPPPTLLVTHALLQVFVPVSYRPTSPCPPFHPSPPPQHPASCSPTCVLPTMHSYLAVHMPELLGYLHPHFHPPLQMNLLFTCCPPLVSQIASTFPGQHMAEAAINSQRQWPAGKCHIGRLRSNENRSRHALCRRAGVFPLTFAASGEPAAIIMLAHSSATRSPGGAVICI